MMSWKKVQIVTDNNEVVSAQAPLIISASRSTDIGQYNTCAHLCEYCYANASKESARDNYKRHLSNPDGECIVNI